METKNTSSLDLLILYKSGYLPIVQVIVKNWTRCDRGRFKGEPLITPTCVSVGEFEYEIRRLHRELDIIVSKGRRFYRHVS